MSDQQATWLFDAFILLTVALGDAVLMSFYLHLSLAQARMERPELAGGRLLASWLVSVLCWLPLSVVLARTGTAWSGEAGLLGWAGLLYPLVAWPAPFLAGKAGLKVPRSYFAFQLAIALALALLGLL